MNKNASETLKENVVYLILLAIFVIGNGLFVWSQMNGASTLADYYSKETSKVINLAEVGDKIEIDIHRATKVALRNGIRNLNETATFDNEKNEICYKLSPGKKTCYNFFNDVEVINKKIKLGSPVNILQFEIAEAKNEL